MKIAALFVIAIAGLLGAVGSHPGNRGILVIPAMILAALGTMLLANG